MNPPPKNYETVEEADPFPKDQMVYLQLLFSSFLVFSFSFLLSIWLCLITF